MSDNTTPTSIKLLYGDYINFVNYTAGSEGSVLFANNAENNNSYLYFDNGTKCLNIVPQLLTVPNGGTGCNSFTAGEVLVGNGTNNITTRAITNLSALNSISKDSTNLITEKTLANWNGSYDAQGASSINYVGTITKGTWNGSTIEVSYGGTGCNTFTTNGILYGNDKNALNVTAAGSDGQIFSSINGMPSYITPSLTWTNGKEAGPTLNLVLSKTTYSAKIPAATNEKSGIVTCSNQTFAGNKSFMGNIILSTSHNIYPETAGVSASGTNQHYWANVQSLKFIVRNNQEEECGSFYAEEIPESLDNYIGKTYLKIGNAIDYTDENKKSYNTKGFLSIYNKNATCATIVSDTENNEKTIAIPNYSGNMVISNTSDTNSSTEAVEYRLPFFEDCFKYLGSNDGYILKTLSGGKSQLGFSRLILGNNKVYNQDENHKSGAITLYGYNNESFTITPDLTRQTKVNTDIEYILSLPVPDSIQHKGELLFHDIDTSIGSDSNPVYITESGKPAAISILSVEHGGTGRETLTKGYAIIGNGADAVSLRAITNITTAGNITSNTNLITANTLNHWKGTSNIATVGTITTGTWQGTSIQIAYGGTGTNVAPVPGGIIYGATAKAYASTNAGSAGQLLQSNGASAPTWITGTKGSSTKPVYLKNGVLTECSKSFSSYLPLAGGTMTGPICFNTTSYGTSFPSANDSSSGQLYFMEDDGVLITNNYGTGDPNSSTPGWNTEGAIYFKILED